MNAAGIQIGAEGLPEMANSSNAGTTATLADARCGLSDASCAAPLDSGMGARGEFRSLIEALGILPRPDLSDNSVPRRWQLAASQGQDPTGTLPALPGEAVKHALKATNVSGRALARCSLRTAQCSGLARKTSNRGGFPAADATAAQLATVPAESGVSACLAVIDTRAGKVDLPGATLNMAANDRDSHSAGVSPDPMLEHPAMKAMVTSVGIASSAPRIMSCDTGASGGVTLHDSTPAFAPAEEAQTKVALVPGPDGISPSGADPAPSSNPGGALPGIANTADQAGEPKAFAVPDPVNPPDRFRNDPGKLSPSFAARTRRASGRTSEHDTKSFSAHSSAAGFDSAIQAKGFKPVEGTSMNAPAARELGGSGNTGERQINASHHAGARAGDPFTALDSDGANPPGTWIHAGAHRAEAGYLDPSLGWIRVHADSTGGAVHAALVPGSAEAAQVLGGHMPGLKAYLSEHHAERASVTMAAPQDGGNGMLMGRGSGDRPPAHQQEGAHGCVSETEVLAGNRIRAETVPTGIPAFRARGAGQTISVMA